ncbi:M23 family metallopeptidase [Streptomyces sp. TRM70308]|uniref:M23 family metallopeptidase n=1 Tax=Streptomyces sp. TRM70308 TaxID=3131932 RepID=UPI003D05FE14
MASSRSATGTGLAGSPTYEVYGPALSESDDSLGTWNPTTDSVRPVRGRHRVAKQRGMARSGAVLGVGMVAAIGAGGMASAQSPSTAPVSMPDLSGLTDGIPGASLLAGDAEAAADPADAAADPAGTADAAPTAQAVLTGAENGTDAGEALRSRILQQANAQQAAADAEAARAAVDAEATAAAEEAARAAKAEAEAEAERQRKAEEERKRKAEEERLRKLAASYALPLSSYQLTSSFGDSGSMWASNHTGQDFAAPTGTPVKAVHGGTVKEAGWAGSYGYRIVLQLDDGTEIWYCHLSSMTVTSGQVTTGDTIGRVGSTGNSSGPHLHLEVRPGGGDPVDPLSWLRGKGLNI